jgi:hypothetical protein
MIKRGRQKSRSYMTLAAIVEGWHVESRFAGCGGTIVTGGTVINDAGMVIFSPGECCGVMT